jgi:hypothetical protein
MLLIIPHATRAAGASNAVLLNDLNKRSNRKIGGED